MSRRKSRWRTERLVSGSVMSCATPFTKCSSVCEPSAEKSAAVSVRVDVGNGVLLQFGVVLFAPFARTEQAGLLAIPRTIDDGAFRPPTPLDQFTQRAGFFQFGNLT